MAASDTEIANLALLRVGSTVAISSLSEQGSSEALACRTVYAQARDILLEEWDWPFARRRATLAQLSSTRTDWGYVYALPSDCVAPRVIIPGGRRDVAEDQKTPFQVEANDTGDGQVLLCDVSQAELRYTMRFTAVGRFTPGFCNALSWLMASELAMALKKDKELADRNTRFFGAALGSAKAASLRSGQEPQEAPSKYIRVRE